MQTLPKGRIPPMGIVYMGWTCQGSSGTMQQSDWIGGHFQFGSLKTESPADKDQRCRDASPQQEQLHNREETTAVAAPAKEKPKCSAP